MPSSVLVFKLRIPEPAKSCKIIDEVTIGPIPRLIIAPKSVPNIVERKSNLSRAFLLNP